MGVIISQLEKKSDNRGWVLQGLQYSNKFEKTDIKDIVVQTINIGKVRGEHYHRRKTEWLLTLKGKADLFWCEFNGNVKKEIMDEKNSRIFKIEPYTCHWIKNNYGKKFLMVAFSTQEYDPNNPDNPKCMNR